MKSHISYIRSLIISYCLLKVDFLVKIFSYRSYFSKGFSLLFSSTHWPTMLYSLGKNSSNPWTESSIVIKQSGVVEIEWALKCGQNWVLLLGFFSFHLFSKWRYYYTCCRLFFFLVRIKWFTMVKHTALYLEGFQWILVLFSLLTTSTAKQEDLLRFPGFCDLW